VKKVGVILIALTLGCAHVPILAREYHVNPKGNDRSIGTAESPLQTIAEAGRRVKPGDKVIVESGAYHEDIVFSRSGKKFNPITFIGVNHPKIIGKTVALRISGDHINIEGFEIIRSKHIGVLVEGSNIILENNNIHHNQNEGIRILDAKKVSVVGGKIFENGPGNATGIWIQGKTSDILIKNTEIFSRGIQRSALSTWEGEGSRGITLENVRIHDHPGYGVWFLSEDNSNSATHITISGCHFKHNGIGKIHKIKDLIFRAGNLLLDHAHNSVIENNIFEEGQGWGIDSYASNNVVFRNNLFINNFDTQKNPVGQGFGLEVNAGIGNRVINNIFFGNKTGFFSSYFKTKTHWPPTPASVTVENNIFYKNDRNFLSMHEKTAPSELPVIFIRRNNFIDVDPEFINVDRGNYHLKAGSPGVDMGTASTLLLDKDGKLRPLDGNEDGKAMPDIGPYEFSVKSN